MHISKESLICVIATYMSLQRHRGEVSQGTRDVQSIIACCLESGGGRKRKIESNMRLVM